MDKSKVIDTPGAQEALEAVRTLIRWAGDDPERPGMKDTPERVLSFYKDFFKGYREKKKSSASAAIAPAVSYRDFILVRDIRIASFCEHHMLPATGSAHIAYIPGEQVAGLGAFARIAALRAGRLTTQEAITSGIAEDIEESFAPRGCAVYIEMTHGCMGLRDPQQQESRALTVKFSGVFLNDPDIQKQFLTLIGKTAENLL